MVAEPCATRWRPDRPNASLGVPLAGAGRKLRPPASAFTAEFVPGRAVLDPTASDRPMSATTLERRCVPVQIFLGAGTGVSPRQNTRVRPMSGWNPLARGRIYACLPIMREVRAGTVGDSFKPVARRRPPRRAQAGMPPPSEGLRARERVPATSTVRDRRVHTAGGKFGCVPNVPMGRAARTSGSMRQTGKRLLLRGRIVASTVADGTCWIVDYKTGVLVRLEGVFAGGTRCSIRSTAAAAELRRPEETAGSRVDKCFRPRVVGDSV